MDLAEVPQTYNRIQEEMFKELVFSIYKPNLLIFLAERKLFSAEEIGKASDRFDEHAQVMCESK